jgi:hypothetical protein
MSTLIARFLARIVRSERGIALPVTMSVLLIAALLGVAAAGAAMTSVQDSTRDRSVKRAVESADAGIDIAAYRLNKLAPVFTDTAQCAVVGGSGTLTTEAVQADGWCRVQTESLEDGASYSYRVSARQQVSISGQDYLQRKIVSTGTVNGVNRRAVTVANSEITTTPLFPVAGVASLAKLSLNSNAQINGGAASNSDIEATSNAKICGDAHPGPGESFIGPDNCPGYSRAPAAADFSLAEVTIPSTNDNATLNGVSGWNASQRTLISGSGTITLTGNIYVFCYLEFTSNGTLNVGTRTSANPLRIYIDSPANCSTSNEGSVLFNSNAVVNNPNSDPTTAQLYLKGTPLGTAPRNQSPLTVDNNPFDTWVRLDSNFFSSGMVIYAPNSEVTLNSNSRVIGAIAAGKVHMDSNSIVDGNDLAKNIVAGVITGLAQREGWVECTPTPTGATPDSGC